MSLGVAEATSAKRLGSLPSIARDSGSKRKANLDEAAAEPSTSRARRLLGPTKPLVSKYPDRPVAAFFQQLYPKTVIAARKSSNWRSR